MVSLKLYSVAFCLVLLYLPLALFAQQGELSAAEQRQLLQQQLAEATLPEQQGPLLIQLTQAFVTHDPHLSLGYASQWLNSTKDRQSTDYQKLLLEQITAYMLLGDYQQGYQTSVEVERLAREKNDIKQLFNALRRQADNLNRLGQADKALPKALEAMQIAIDANNPVPLQIIRYDLAHIYLNLAAYPQAIQIASDGLDLAMTGDDSNGQANFLHLLAEASGQYQQHQEAEDFARKALELRLSRQEQALVAQYYLSLARSLLSQQKYQDSEQQLQLALQAAQKVDNKKEQADALQSLAWLDLHFGRTEQADQKYQQIRQLLQADNFAANLRIFSLQHLTALLEFNQLEQASALYRTLALQASLFAEPQNQLNFWTVTAKLAHFEGKSAAAFQAAEQAIQLQRQLFDDKLHKQALVIASEQHKNLLELKLQQAEQQNQLAQLNQQHQKYMLLLLCAGGFLAIALLLSLFYHKSRRNQLLLQKQQEMAQQKIAVKNEFIATLGHEIRTPLQGIDAVLAQLLPELTEQSSQQKIKLARRSVWSLDNIINNILTSSRLEHGAYHLSEQQVAPTELLHRLHDLLEPLAQNKGLKLTSFIAPNVPALLILDENLLTQLLTNLISNAVKYTQQGEIEVRVELDPRQQNNLTLLFKVRDTGIGLTQLQISRLLRGERLEQQRALQAGPGLGMLVCQKLLQQVGSVLQIQSLPGVGTEMSFSLNCKNSDMLPEQSKPGVAAADCAANRALVAEDDELCRLSLQQYLTELGFTVSCVASLAQLQQLPPQSPWSWVFLDGQLDDADAGAVIDYLQQQKQINDSSRLVMISGSAQPQRPPQISLVLTKPWRREQLQSSIAQLAQLPPLHSLYQAEYLQEAIQALNQPQRQQLLSHVIEQLHQLRLQLKQAPPDAKVIHRMIGSMGQLGLLRLSQLCRLSEQQLLQQGTIDSLMTMQLELCLEQSQAEIQILFARLDVQC